MQERKERKREKEWMTERLQKAHNVADGALLNREALSSTFLYLASSEGESPPSLRMAPEESDLAQPLPGRHPDPVTRASGDGLRFFTLLGDYLRLLNQGKLDGALREISSIPPELSSRRDT